LEENMEKEKPHAFIQKKGEPRLLCECGRPLADHIHNVERLPIKGIVNPTIVR
jgi:hypothetical protein